MGKWWGARGAAAVIAVGATATGLALWLNSGETTGAHSLEQGAESERRDRAVAKRSFLDPSAATPPATVGTGPYLRFEPDDGQELAFGFSMGSSAAVEMSAFVGQPSATPSGAGRPTALELNASGALNLKFYPMPDGTWTVGATLANARYTLNGQEPNYVADLHNPFSFRMTERGQLSNFEYARGTDPAAAMFLSQLLGSMQIVLPEDPVNRWKTREEDGTGKFVAEYSVSKAPKDSAKNGDDDRWLIQKNKLEYLSMRSSATGFMLPSTRVTTELDEAEGTATLSVDGAWFESLEETVELTQSSANEEIASSDTRLRAWRAARSASVEFPETAEEFAATLRSSKFIVADIERTNPELDRMAEGLDFNGALQKYRELATSGKPGAQELAEDFFVNYLKLQPDASSELIDAMNRQPAGFSDDEQLTLWRLVAESGTPEAQNAVMAAAQDSKARDATRIRALAYASDFEYPTEEFVGHLWNEYQALPGGNTGDINSQVKTMSLFALGLLGYEKKLNDAVKPQIGAHLATSLESATTSWDRAMALRAIGNYGNADMLPSITPYLEDASPEVRAAAYWSLRRIDDPAAAGILMSSLDEEGNFAVRQMALRTLTRMVPTAEGMEWARWELEAISHPEEQVALAQYLGNSLSRYPQNELALRQLLASNPPRAVKQAIYAYIAPKG